MTEDLLIGVIGAGGRGALAHHAHNPQAGVRLVAAADTKQAPLTSFREKFGPDVLTTNDHRELLARPEIGAVFVTSPDFMHEEQAIASLRAGKHVYLEKPMALTIEGCDRILRAAVESGRKLYLGHNMRHMTFVLKMKELIDEGRIGEVKAGWCRHFVSYGGDAYFKDWHAEKAKCMSLLLQKGAHDIDVLHWLCHGYSRRVTAFGGLTVYGHVTDHRAPDEPPKISWGFENWPPLAQKGLNPVVDIEDINMMLMELDNGVFASYQQCHYTPDAWRNYTIIGTEGRVENFGDCPGECFIALWDRRGGYKPQGDLQFPIPAVEGSHGGADPAIVDEFVLHVREGARASTSPVAARNSVAAGYSAAQSARNGNVPVDVPPVDPAVADYFSNCG